MLVSAIILHREHRNHNCSVLFTDFFKKAIEKAQQTKVTNVKVRMDSPVIISTCMACNLYITALNTLTQLKLDILTGEIDDYLSFSP